MSDPKSKLFLQLEGLAWERFSSLLRDLGSRPDNGCDVALLVDGRPVFAGRATSHVLISPSGPPHSLPGAIVKVEACEWPEGEEPRPTSAASPAPAGGGAGPGPGSSCGPN